MAERDRGRDLAGRLSMRVLTRSWQMLLKALEELALAPNAMMAAEMAVIRLTHVADLPPPEELVRRLTDEGAAAPPRPRPPPAWRHWRRTGGRRRHGGGTGGGTGGGASVGDRAHGRCVGLHGAGVRTGAGRGPAGRSGQVCRLRRRAGADRRGA